MRSLRELGLAGVVAVGALGGVACSGDDDGGSGPPTRVPTTVNQAGNGQSGTAGGMLPLPIAVTVLDQDGDPMSGVSVTFAVTAGGGSLGTPTTTTNASGVASTTWTLGTATGTNNNTASASVTGYGGAALAFTASAAAAAPASVTKTAGDAQTGEVAQATAVQPKVTVQDAFGNAAAGVAVTWTVLGGGGAVSATTSATNGAGEAVITWTLGPTVGVGVHSLRAAVGVGTYSATFTASGVLTAGYLSIDGGDNQTAVAGTAVPSSPAVLVEAPGGAPVAGVAVTWAVTAGGGSVFPATSVTSASGVASTQWTLGATPGSNNQGLTATVAGLTGSPVAFVASATAPPTQMTLSSGDGQTAAAAQALAQPLVVLVQDAGSNPVAGVVVSWQVTAGGGTLGAATSTTDAAGLASMTYTVGTAAGAGNQTVQASVTGLAGSPVSFTASVTAAAATQMLVAAGDNQSATVGTALAGPIAVEVRDTYGNPKPGITVNWAAAGGSGSTGAASSVTDGSGIASTTWTLGTTAGTGNQAATATVAGLIGSPITFHASATAGPPATLAVAGGDNQTAVVGTALPTPLAVTVTDAYGNGIGGVSVSWVAATGGGSMAAATSMTGTGGAASNTWTLGPAVGGQTATASVAGTTPASVTFNAAGTPVVSTFAITLRYLTPLSPARQAVFDSAAARWASVIVGDLVDAVVNAPAGAFCGPTTPAINETIDDVLIFVTLDSIDGPSQVLGSAGPCARRTGTRFTAIGQMRFDTADVAMMETNNIFTAVILHEMGHVLGIGSLWNPTGLTPLVTGAGGADPYFTGVSATARFNAQGGGTYVGNKVPVENTGGAGTRDSHWREAVMGKELMTGWVSVVANPLSAITVGSLQDMGYTVSYVTADAYTVDGTNLRAPGGAGEFKLEELAPTWPILEVDARGRMVRPGR